MTREEQMISESQKRYDDIAFLDGVKWADEHPVNVWHDASEEPKGDEWQKCNRIFNMRLGVVNTMNFECIDDSLIDFPKLRTETMEAIKAEVAELESEFENL